MTYLSVMIGRPPHNRLSSRRMSSLSGTHLAKISLRGYAVAAAATDISLPWIDGRLSDV
jgi:hypothetical protein